MVREKLLQDLEMNKKDYYRLRQNKISTEQQIKFIKLFMDEEDKRTAIKLKQQEKYFQLKNEKKIQQLRKIQQQMNEMMQHVCSHPKGFSPSCSGKTCLFILLL